MTGGANIEITGGWGEADHMVPFRSVKDFDFY